MPAEKLGDARCPLCGGTARVSLSKSGFAVMTMNCCNAQLFTRSPRSDESVRDLIKPAQQGGGVPAAPVAAPKAPAAPITSTPPVASPVAAPVPAPAPSRGFGMLQW